MGPIDANMLMLFDCSYAYLENYVLNKAYAIECGGIQQPMEPAIHVFKINQFFG